jgi:ATP-dependent helicase/nuclease subunit A
MSDAVKRPPPPDQRDRERALDSGSSILVQAPAGSGKTDLLTRRFLRLLGAVDAPGEIVAITFTIAAAAEMRHRILGRLEEAASSELTASGEADELSMQALARRALIHSNALGWNLIETPEQLRISTIDSFCRELAIQQPLLSGLGGGIQISEQTTGLYRRAASRTLRKIDEFEGATGAAVEALLNWRDNNWQEMEELLVKMLEERDRWMHEFVVGAEPDWEALRKRLERPFANAVHEGLTKVSRLLDGLDGSREELLELARYACEEPGENSPWGLAERVEIPSVPFIGSEALEDAREAFVAVAELVLTEKGQFRKQVDMRAGFPTGPRAPKGFERAKSDVLRGQMGSVPLNRKDEKKAQMLRLLRKFGETEGLETELASIRNLPPVRYTEDEWQIVRACFTLLRQAAAELQVVFAEAGVADFTEVAQIALHVLKNEDEFPSDAALAAADGIRHLLVDEFQDTSRRQHELLARLVVAWPEREGRTCFVVGDPMQSIYFFRGADAELFPRVRDAGLEIPNAEPLRFAFVPLTANFRTAPALVERLNESFGKIFAEPDGSGITFSQAIAARDEAESASARLALHVDFVPQSGRGAHAGDAIEIDAAREAQTAEIVDLIRNHQPQIRRAREAQERGEDAKYRVAVLGRTYKAMAPIAEALREALIPFRAVDLEGLGARPEVLDALALAHALMNAEDRVAWLGVLRAPWCGLALDDMHRLVSNDDEELLMRPIPELLNERMALLSDEGQAAVGRVMEGAKWAAALRAAMPNASLGTWLEQVWLRLGGADCVDAAGRANLDLLWSCLDKLPGGERDLTGPAIDAALEKLKALPDPASSSECGVQLMTIHKAKGLEFEIVIVPELQAGRRHRERTLLSWMERGLAEPDGSGEVTEFLIAPLQSKGADAGSAKKWVDRMRAEREAQEERRLLYVAATRAREELHLFARPAYKIEKDGSAALVEPKNSLLATAWPALEEDVRKKFDEWKAYTGQKEPEPAEILAIAAQAEATATKNSSVGTPTLLRRLPASYKVQKNNALASIREETGVEAGRYSARLYERHEGGLLSRGLGHAVHALLEELSRLSARHDWETARLEIQKMTPRIAAELRSLGIARRQAEEIAAEALGDALNASNDAHGKWILSAHPDAASEVRWASVIDGSVRTVQVDRVFRAGIAPLEDGENCWWIVDYKTYAATKEFDAATALPKLRELFAPQLEAYATVLRKLHGSDTAIFAGLYYPRMLLLDWWEM